MVNGRKSSRRDFLRGVAVLGSSVLLGACAPATAPAVKEEVKEAAEPVAAAQKIPELGPYIAHTDIAGSLDFWNCWGGERIPLMEGQIADFQKYYPNVTIGNNVSPCAGLLEMELTAIAGGEPPDVIMLQSNSMPMFVEQDALIPLDEYIARDELDLGIYFPGEIGTHIYKGKVYSLPNVNGGAWHLLYWHKGYFAEIGLDPESPPVTWSDLDSMADQAAAQGHFLLEPSRTFNEPMFLVWLYNNGGQYMTEDGIHVAFDTDEGLKTLEWMLAFVKRQADKYEAMASGSAREEHVPVAEFCARAYMSYISGSWEVGHLRADCPDTDYGIARLPYNAANPEAKQTTPISGGWGFCIPKGVKEENIPAAWEWIKYISAGEGNHKFTKAQARPSPVIAYTNDPDLPKLNKYWSVIIEDLENATPMPVTPVHPQIKTVIRTMEDDVLYEKKTPAEALEWCVMESQKLLDEWWAKAG